MCSENGQALIRNAIKEHGLTGVVVCSCSPRMHEATFRKCAERAGINPYMVTVEADVNDGMPTFDIVGLPDNAVKESKNRVRSAIKNSGYKFPSTKITINLAPADLKKEGSFYDLPILVAILNAFGEIKCDFTSSAFLGEVSLDVENGLPKHLVLPRENF